jgi:hypothetical protein
MAIEIPELRPGDLILADHMNKLVAELKSHAKKLADLERAVKGRQALGITGLLSTGVRVGERLHVFGRNFGTPSRNVVRIDGQPVGPFQDGSDDGNLLFEVLPVPEIPAGGRLATLTITNDDGEIASTHFQLLQGKLPLQGNVVIGALEWPETIEPPGCNIDLRLLGFANAEEQYDVEARVENAGEAGWKASVTPAVIKLPAVTSPQGSPGMASVHIDLPATATGATLTVTVGGQTDPSIGGTRTWRIVTGKQTGMGDVPLAFLGLQSGGVLDGLIAIGTVSSEMKLRFRALLPVQAVYAFSATEAKRAWTMNRVSPPGVDATSAPPGSPSDFVVSLTPTTAAKSVILPLVVSVSEPGGRKGEFSLDLQAVP